MANSLPNRCIAPQLRLTLIALLMTFSVPFGLTEKLSTPTAQTAESQIAQFAPPVPPNPGSPSGRGQGGGARESTQPSSSIA